MIRYRLALLMGERKMRISDMMRETDLSRTSGTLPYKKNPLKADLETLDKLSDLLVQVPN